jgi:hypothetical protein
MSTNASQHAMVMSSPLQHHTTPTRHAHRVSIARSRGTERDRGIERHEHTHTHTHTLSLSHARMGTQSHAFQNMCTGADSSWSRSDTASSKSKSPCNCTRTDTHDLSATHCVWRLQQARSGLAAEASANEREHGAESVVAFQRVITRASTHAHNETPSRPCTLMDNPD